MTFKGLFIGIDRYASTEINWLAAQAVTLERSMHCLPTRLAETALLTD
jgi:hypothetical protein